MFILNLFKRKKAFKNRNKGKEPPVLKAPEITPVPFPENAEIEILYMHYCGMAMGSHYILKKTDKGVFMKISSDSPDSYEMTMDKEGRQTTEESYSEFADIVKECEIAKSVRLSDNSAPTEIKELAEKYGALGFNGNYHTNTPSGMLDGGDSYTFYMKLSDGMTVEMSGYNSVPDGYRDFSTEVQKIFHDTVKPD